MRREALFAPCKGIVHEERQGLPSMDTGLTRRKNDLQ